MADTLRLAGAFVSPHTHQEADISDGSIYARLAADETVGGAWTFPSLAVASSISVAGTVDGVDVSAHAPVHERGGSQTVRASRLYGGPDASKPATGNSEADVWWAADTDKLYVWNGTLWKEVGGGGAGGGGFPNAADIWIQLARP